MEQKNTRYKDLEQFLTILVVAMLALFIFYLVMASGGKTVLQIIAAVMIGAIAAFGLWLLVKNRELLREADAFPVTGDDIHDDLLDDVVMAFEELLKI